MPLIVRIALLIVWTVSGGCMGSERSDSDAARARVKDALVTIEGKVHCGPVRECTGAAFLVYTDHGGKVVRVTPSADRNLAQIRARLADGVRVEIAGIKRSQVSMHQYEITATQLSFPASAPSARSGTTLKTPHPPR